MRNINPYEILGCARDANAEEIKAAWKATARRLHPDKGGDPGAFAEARMCYDILKDEARRAKYDATGDINESEPDNPSARVISIVMPIIIQMAEQFANGRGGNPATNDWVKVAKQLLEERIKAIEVHRVVTARIKETFSMMVNNTRVVSTKYPPVIIDMLKSESEFSADEVFDNDAADLRLAIDFLDTMEFSQGLLQ